MPYSKRKYNTKKFQTGGVVGTAGGYDWRDDPYEQQLAQAKLQRERMDVKKGQTKSKTSNIDKMPKLSFTPLSGGLTGSTRAAQAVYSQAKDALYSQVKALGDQGIPWLNSVDGQRAYQQVLDLGTSLQVKLKNEKEQFDKLNDSLNDTDMNTLAITGDKAFVGYQVKDSEGKVKNQIGFVNLDDYYKDPSKYQIMTMRDFSTWKANVDTSMDTETMNAFLGKGAISQETFYDDYIKDKVGDIGLEFVKGTGNGNGMITLVGQNGDGNSTFHKDNLRKYINSVIDGTTGLDNLPTSSTELKSNSEKLKGLIDTVYKRVNDSVPQSSRLLATMQAAILQDKNNQATLSKLSSPAERKAWVNEQMKIELASRILLNEKIERKRVKNSGGGGSGPNPKSENSRQVAGMLAFVQTKEGADTMDIDMPSASSDVNKMTFQAVKIKGGVVSSTTEIGVDASATDPEKAKQNFFGKNDYIQKNLKTDEVYTLFGGNLADALDAENGTDSGKQLIGEGLLIEPNSSIDIVYLPTMDGKAPAVEFMQQMEGPKLAVREAFIKSYNAHHPKDKIKASARELMPNNLNSTKNKDYTKFLNWLQYAKDMDAYEKESKNPNKSKADREVAMRRLAMGKEASKILTTQNNKAKAILKGRRVVLKAFAKVPVVANADSWYIYGGNKINDVIEKGISKVFDKTFAKGAAKHFVKKKGAYGDYVENMGQDAVNPLSDNNYGFDVFVPFENAGKVASNNGQNVLKARQQQEIQSAMEGIINGSTYMGDGDVDAMIKFFGQ